MKRVLVLAFALVVLGTTPVLAHVTVQPSEVAAGSFATLTFIVQNESEAASTTEVEVAFPEAAPFSSARTKPVAGWEAEVVMAGDRVGSIVWSGGSIGPSEFQELEVAVGPIPEIDVLELKTVQTYDDGEVVRWIDPVIDGEDEPEHPAPTVRVVERDGDDGHGGGAEEGGAATAAADVDPDDDAEHGTDPVAFAGLLLAGVALIAAVVALVISRNRLPH